MNTIFAIQEKWDDNIGFNRPCGVSPKWMKDENNKFPYTMGPSLFDNLKKDGPNSLRQFINREYVNVKYKYKAELLNKKYFYIINIYEPMFFNFNEAIGFSCIDIDILTDIKKGRCKLILVQDVEGLSGCKNTYHEKEFKLIDSWCRKVDIPYENVYYISGNLKSAEIAKKQRVKTNIIPITVQETWNNVLNSDSKVVDFLPIDDSYLYLNYSRRPRLHRTLLLLKIFKNNLNDNGLWSFNSMDNEPEINEYEKLDKDVLPYVANLYVNSPFLIDLDNSPDSITVHVPIDNYERTFINVVGETISDNSVLFISEKTWKPILVGMPFIINGNVGTLAYLKKEGFKTFDTWIDESYDSEPDLNKRLDMIIYELNKFKAKSIEELKKIREEMKPICIYNKNVLIKRTRTKFYTNDTYHPHKPVSEILNSIWWSEMKNN